MHSLPMSDEQRVVAAARGLLRSIGRLSRDLYQAGEFGLSRSHVSVLDALETRGLRVTELAADTGLTQPRVTVVLQELVERGLAARTRCTTDRRAVDASITPEGRQYLEEARQRMAGPPRAGARAPPRRPARPGIGHGGLRAPGPRRPRGRLHPSRRPARPDRSG